MAVIKKTLFDEHLEKINVLVNDTDSDSKYFKITELPGTFTGGKNAFLIQGSNYLVGDTLVKIQIKDSKGDIIYYEPGQGIPEYYEGTSKVVSVYIYPDTAYGPCTITILGELNEYDSNGFRIPVPENWADTYNVKWTKQINVNPSLPNVTKVRFYRRPQISIYESIQPLYTRTITRSTLSTGTIKGVSINPAAETNYRTYAGETNYQLQLTGANFSSSMVGEIVTINGLPQQYAPTIENVINSSTAKVAIPYFETSSAASTDQIIKEFSGKTYSLQYTSNTEYSSSFFSSSYASITLTDLETFTGDANRIKIFAKSLNQNAGYKLLDDFTLESSELLITSSYNKDINVRTGLFRTQDIINTFWTQSIINGATALVPTYDNTTMVASVKLLGNATENTTDLPRNKFTTKDSTSFLKNTEYQLDYTPLLSSSLYENNKIEIYASGSAFLDSNEYKIGKLIDTTSAKSFFQRYDKKQINFKPDQDGSGKIVFVTYQGQWQLSDLSLRASSETFFSPNEINVNVNVPTVIPNETFDFKFEFYDINNNLVYPLTVEKQYTFTGGNDTVVGTITVVNNSIVNLSGSVSGNIAGVSSSISGTMTVYSSSASGSVGRLSGSVSGSITTLSSSVSGTISNLSSSVSSSNVFILSSSLSKTQELANGQFSGSFIGDTVIYSPTIGGQQGYISSLFKVGTTPSIYLDARQNPRKIFIGGAVPSGETEASGAFNNSNTSVYLDSAGKFSLGNKLSYSAGTLTVTGQINIEAGGNAATTTYAQGVATTAKDDAISAAASDATAKANAVDLKVFTDSTGKLTKTPSESASGLYLGSTYLGYYNGSAWKTYMSNTGNFFLSGTGNNGLSWNGNALSIDGAITARSGYIGNGTSGWAINSTNICSSNGQTILNATDGTIKLRDANGITKVSLNYDTTNATDPLNATQGTVAVTGISAGTAYYANGALSGQGPNGYLQVPQGPSPFWAPTWNIDSNFTVPLTANYEFTLRFPVSSALYALKTGGGGSPFIQVRLYIWRNSDGANMNPRGYISIPDEGPNGQAVGTGYYAQNQFNTFYASGIPLVAGVGYRFNIQYIVVNCDYDTELTIGYYLPSINGSYFAAVASSNMNQSGLNLGQDTDRYIFTKPGSLNFYEGRSSATARQTIGEQAGSMLLLNSDLYGYFNDFQRLYINNAQYPKSNRSSGGNFITSHFYGGWNRSFLNLRAYTLFEPDATTGVNLFGAPNLWAYALNVDKVTYVTTNTFDITFVEPLYGTEGFPENGGGNIMSAALALDGALGIALMDVTNKTPYGCRILLNAEDSTGGRVALLVYK